MRALLKDKHIKELSFVFSIVAMTPIDSVYASDLSTASTSASSPRYLAVAAPVGESSANSQKFPAQILKLVSI